MNPHNHDSIAREQLSALFDGELTGDAARFALKRLSGDPDARMAFGSWQLAGDVLRGQASAGAPAGFADRIHQALAYEASSAGSSRDSVDAPRRRWAGGAALAASVALAALFVARPFDAPMAPAPGAISATPASAPPVSPAPQVPAPQPSRQPVEGLASVTEKPTPASTRGPRSAAPRAGAAATQRSAPTARSAPLIETATVADAPLLDAGADPFRRLPTVIASRPWPRSTLPGFRGGNALTTSYGDRSDSPRTGEPPRSFYPFEPRLPSVQGAVDTAGAQQP